MPLTGMKTAVPASVAGNSVRVFRMKKFPYKLFYSFDEAEQFVRIYAVMHEKQRPDYWRNRVGEQSGA